MAERNPLGRAPKGWACIALPHLELDILRFTQPPHSTPLAIVDHAQRIVDANRAARRAGVRPGQRQLEALAVCGRLQVLAEHRLPVPATLEQLCGLLQAFSDWVVPEPRPTNAGATRWHRILLEIGGSLRLFGGANRLQRRILHRLRRLGYTARIGLGACPEQARLAVHWATAANAPAQAVHSATDDPPLGLTGIARPDAIRLALIEALAPWCPALARVGVVRLDQLLAIPRTALGRRYGAAMLRALQRLLDECPERPPRWTPAPRFVMALELPRIEHCEGLHFPLRRLLQHLEADLRTRDRQIDTLGIAVRLEREGDETQASAARWPQSVTASTPSSASATHGHQPADPDPSWIRLTLRRDQPTASAAAWWALARLRLERWTLPAPACAIELRAETLLRPTPASAPLNLAVDRPASAANTDAHGWAVLRARLGDGAIRQWHYTGRLRPETAIAASPWLASRSVSNDTPRPASGTPDRRQTNTTSSLAQWWSEHFGRPLWRLPTPLLQPAPQATLPLENHADSPLITDSEHHGQAPSAPRQPSASPAPLVFLGRFEGAWWERALRDIETDRAADPIAPACDRAAATEAPSTPLPSDHPAGQPAQRSGARVTASSDLRGDVFRLLDDEGRWCWVIRDLRSGRWWRYGYWG